MFALWIKQEGEGCDYTIGCGNKLITLSTDDITEAETKAKEFIEENTYAEQQFETALLVEIMKDISSHCDIAVKLREEADRLKELARKQREIDRLTKELNK